MCTTRIVKAILNDENCILPVSAYLNGQYGIKDIFTGVPAIINRNGVREVFDLNIAGTERDKLQHSVDILRQTLDTVR